MLKKSFASDIFCSCFIVDDMFSSEGFFPLYLDEALLLDVFLNRLAEEDILILIKCILNLNANTIIIVNKYGLIMDK